MSELGQRLIDSVYARMIIDDKWSVRERRGFSWWPGRLKAAPSLGQRPVDRCDRPRRRGRLRACRSIVAQ